MHQFEKVEQFIICAADDEESDRWHAELLGAAEHLLQGLELHYEVVECATGDMGAGKYRMNDVNTWFPSLGRFRETHSCSSLHDWQARRASIRYRDTDNGEVRLHAEQHRIATPRLLAAVVENDQTADQKIRVPQVLSRISAAGLNCSPSRPGKPGGPCTVGRERRTLRGVELQADRVAELAHRPVAQLRRRDVAIALLTVAAEDALTSLPAIRRGLLAAGNPLSAPFWDSAEAILQKISGHEATFGDVHGWLEATGTEPTAIIGLHVWEEPDARSPLQEEMHARLVGYLEERVAAGEIDPDEPPPGNEEARREYLAVQERWMTTPLPDGRVPMTVLLHEQDEAFLADWAAADAEARVRAAVRARDRSGERPLPYHGPEAPRSPSCGRTSPGRAGPGRCSSRSADARRKRCPRTRRNWLTLAASVAAPQGDPLLEEDKEFARAMEWAEDEDLDFGDAVDDARHRR